MAGYKKDDPINIKRKIFIDRRRKFEKKEVELLKSEGFSNFDIARITGIMEHDIRTYLVDFTDGIIE